MFIRFHYNFKLSFSDIYDLVQQYLDSFIKDCTRYNVKKDFLNSFSSKSAVELQGTFESNGICTTLNVVIAYHILVSIHFSQSINSQVVLRSCYIMTRKPAGVMSVRWRVSRQGRLSQTDREQHINNLRLLLLMLFFYLCVFMCR